VVTLQVFLVLQENMHKVFVRRIINRAGTYSVIPDGKFLFTLAAALAAWEREILSKRTKEGSTALIRDRNLFLNCRHCPCVPCP